VVSRLQRDERRFQSISATQPWVCMPSARQRHVRFPSGSGPGHGRGSVGGAA
jgi:hypothetical protein